MVISLCPALFSSACLRFQLPEIQLGMHLDFLEINYEFIYYQKLPDSMSRELQSALLVHPSSVARRET